MCSSSMLTCATFTCYLWVHWIAGNECVRQTFRLALFIRTFRTRARGRDSGKGACERVYKRSVGWVPIDAGYSSVKIYSFMFSGSKDLYNEHLGASSAQPRSKLERQVGAAIEMETIAGRLRTSGHVYMDDMFALCAVRPYPCVSQCVCLRVCVCVFV